MILNKVTEDISVAPQITAQDVSKIAAAGFKTIICNRPDGEVFDQPSCKDIELAAKACGLQFIDQPVISGQLSGEDVGAFKENFANAPKPVVAYCRSGTRCVTLWAFSQAGSRPAEEIIALAKGAGYDLSGLAQALEKIL
jgi:uncharacterized protein (TIGR01244 family)